MLLSIENLCVSLNSSGSVGDNTENIISSVSLALDTGKTVGLVGESGSGKSVTARSILRLNQDMGNFSTTGKIVFQGTNMLTLSEKHLRKIRGNRISMIFQEPMISLNPVFTIGNQLLEPMRLHRNLNKTEAVKLAVSLLHRCGIDNPAERLNQYPHQLSGGQRQRMMIAMALACEPDILIADEPTTALDVTIQAQILELLANLQQEMGLAILLISHDLPLVRKMAGHIYIMKEGKIIEQGKTEDIFHYPKTPYTTKLLSSLPQPKKTIQPGSAPLLEVKNLDVSFQKPATLLKTLLFQKKQMTALQNGRFHINSGTTCGIVGESGSGKTTLAHAILRLIHATGSVTFNRRNIFNITGKEMRQMRKEMQIVFQDPFSSLSPRLTVKQILEEGLLIHRKELDRKEREVLIISMLEETGLSQDILQRYPHEFSGGQRQRIAIARVLVLQPKLIIFDEPTSALDTTIQAQLLSLLADIQKKHKLTYLFISHDLRVIRAVADHVIVMQKGKIVEEGRADQIFAQPATPYTRQLLSASVQAY